MTSSKHSVLLLPIGHTILFFFFWLTRWKFGYSAFLASKAGFWRLPQELRIPLRAVFPA